MRSQKPTDEEMLEILCGLLNQHGNHEADLNWVYVFLSMHLLVEAECPTKGNKFIEMQKVVDRKSATTGHERAGFHYYVMLR